MADYASNAKKFGAAEDRLVELLGQLDQARRDVRATNWTDKELAAKCETIAGEAIKQRATASKLFDQLEAQHREHWAREYQRRMAEAREALVPLARAWIIAHRALGEPGAGYAPSWINNKIGPMIMEVIEGQVSRETHDLPIDPPRALAFERADDELRF